MEDLRLLMGGRGEEFEVPTHIDSPTWCLDELWESVKDVALNSLDAYMLYCKEENFPHSYLLGLDILFTAELDKSKPNKLVDIRPTLLEGPCCNSYPACPSFFSAVLYKNLVHKGFNPDMVEYPVHPLKIIDEIAKVFLSIWESKGKKGKPVVAVFTLPYEGSEEEQAHLKAIDAFERFGMETHRITPTENPEVKDGKLFVNGVGIDMVYRRIERIDVPVKYGEELGRKIIEETPDTFFFNPWKVDDLRSKTIEEKCFRRYEKATGKKVSRPKTLLEDEINPENVTEFLKSGGFALKKWNSTGGKGVFLHVYLPEADHFYDYLYSRYDGRHMIHVTEENLAEHLKVFENFTEDAAIQQMRLIDSRFLPSGNKLVYDTRINVLYDPMANEWKFISGLSRVVPCGPKIDNGNTLLTNVSSGAFMAPLVIGKTKEKNDKVNYGPIATAIIEGKTELEIKTEKESEA
ncbi:hypothetical protein KAJ27_00440 [bacterium]|nr:hypothetical protein [bacterium]